MNIPFFDQIVMAAVVLGAAVVKVITSSVRSVLGIVGMVFVAIFCAYVFTEPVMGFLNLPDIYRLAVAASLALIGEGIVRAAIEASQNPHDFLAQVFKRMADRFGSNGSPK